MLHDIRMWGRIVGARSAKQFVKHRLTIRFEQRTTQKGSGHEEKSISYD